MTDTTMTSGGQIALPKSLRESLRSAFLEPVEYRTGDDRQIVEFVGAPAADELVSRVLAVIAARQPTRAEFEALLDALEERAMQIGEYRGNTVQSDYPPLDAARRAVLHAAGYQEGE